MSARRADPPFKWFGPKDSGAFITPGDKWPLAPENIIKKGNWIAVGAVILIFLASTRRK